MIRPLAIDLYCGLGGWTEGLLSEGYFVAGFDVERHIYGDLRYPGHLVLQDVRTIHGSQFKDAALIVASPPCQEYSYMAMPWTRAKQIAKALRGEGEFPEGYKGSRTIEQLNALFDACFRIQREASEAAGHHIPLVVENVKGAQPWVGRARWSYGSYYLWGDVPALMPITMKAQKSNPDGTAHPPGSWFALADSKNRGSRSLGDGVKAGDRNKGRRDGTHKCTTSFEEAGQKNSGASWFNVAHNTESGKSRNPVHDGVKQAGLSGTRANGKGDRWFQDGAAASGSKSSARKAASARIAKIPFALSAHIAHVYLPKTEAAA